MGLFGGSDICRPMDNMLFEGECVPDIEKLKLELLKEEVGCVEYNCGLPTPQKITI